MTVNKCIQYIDSIEPNAYTAAQKAMWISECEGKVYTDLFLLQPNEFTPVTYDADKDRTLALPAPYDRLYPRYLQAMIHYANGEYKRYANSMAEFNEAWGHANRWMGGDYDVTDLWRNQRVEVRVPTDSDEEKILLEVPQGCALVGGRIVVRTAATFLTNDYYLASSLSAGSYNAIADRLWWHFITTREYPSGTRIHCDMRLDPPFRAMPQGEPREDLDSASWKDPEGTDIPDFTEPIPITFWDEKVTEFCPDRRGSTPIPMLIADRGGALLKAAPVFRSQLRTWWNDDGEIIFTAKLLIPAEEFFYHGRRPWQS